MTARRTLLGLTLLELLLAVALSGAVVLGTSFWVRDAHHRARSTGDFLREEAAVEALFAAIERDLFVSDASLRVDEGTARITVGADGGSLSLATRSPRDGVGAIVREYSLRSTSEELLALDRPADADSPRGEAPRARVVLGGVERFEARLDPAKGTTKSLAVEIETVAGRVHHRRWVTP